MSISNIAKPIRTNRLVLRPAVPQDFYAFFAIMRDPHAMRHWSTLPHDTPGAMQAIIPELFAMSDVAALTADVDPLNPGSLKVLAKLGVIEKHRAKRTFDLGGVWADSIYIRTAPPLNHHQT